LVLATYAFAVQIYCDFSGYSDIAIGTALLLGIRLPDNFQSPYLSCSLRDFWRRWHITLSTWLRDYLYIPLGGSRHGPARTYVNLMTTMLLGGLWHGAGWTWVVWGAIHGGVLSFERAIRLADRPRNPYTAALRWLITLHIVCVSWVFFRARGVVEAWEILRRIATLADGTLALPTRPLLYLVVLLLVERLAVRQAWLDLLSRRPTLTRWVVYAAVLLFMLTFAGSESPEFIYFEF
jgi:D-alanyl-lipoteichoic acid acyltransferase DltB (MBOAT superfamily)